MARPKRDGLLYFPMDTDFFYADRRIRALKTRFGSDGIVLYIYLLTEIYREGYYTRWNSDSIDSAMDELGFTEGLIEQVMTFLVSRSLLVKINTLADSDTIITSPGIQKRYQEAAKSLRRDVIVNEDIWLLSEEETASFIKYKINSDKCSKNSDKSRKNSDKCSKNPLKEKEREIETKVKEKPAAEKRPPTAEQMIEDRRFPEAVDAVVREWVKYKIEKRQGYKEIGLRNFLSQVSNNVARYGEKAVVDLMRYCMSQNWQGVIWDRLSAGQNVGDGRPQVKKNSFHNFTQRDNDYAAIQKALERKTFGE